MNLRSIDLNLLVIFDALMAEKGISRAAKAIGMTPSAVSHALSRLRQTFGDPLFDRTPTGMAPTRRARELIGRPECMPYGGASAASPVTLRGEGKRAKRGSYCLSHSVRSQR